VAPCGHLVLVVGPEWLKSLLRRFTPDRISQEDLINQMNDALRLPGLANSWTMPIKGRIEMLSTGLRTPVGLKVSGATSTPSRRSGRNRIGPFHGKRDTGASRGATGSGYFLDFEWNREALARYGLSIEEAQEVVSKAIGGRT